MSKLEELIQQYCPDGVEYKKLGEITTILRGKRLTKSQLSDDKPYAVYHGGLDPLGYYESANRTANTTMIINVGASAGTVGYSKEDFWSSDGCYCIEHSASFDDRYIYYVLQTQEQQLKSKVRVAGIPTLDRPVVEDLIIPVPPLPVQEEIVRILDNFAELQAELQAALQAELQKRLQQYNYYRDKLLSFNELNRGGQSVSVEWKKLGEICLKVCSGGTPSRGNSNYFTGDIPWLRTQEVDWNDIYDTEIKITEDAVKNSSAKLIPENCVIIAMYGATAGKVGINKIPLTTNQACCNLQINPQKALYKYVYYWVCNEYEHLKSLGQGSQNNINAQIIKEYPIPVPPLSEQQRIVDILDRFDTLTTDITAGLPAEIEARRKQYEYYRDQLLTFKQKA